MNAIIAPPAVGATRGKTQPQADETAQGAAAPLPADPEVSLRGATLAVGSRVKNFAPPYALIGCNSAGDIHLSNRANLVSFGTERSTLLASMTVILSHLVVGIGSTESGPDYCFVSDFAAHVQDLAYQVEQANRLLLAGEVA